MNLVLAARVRGHEHENDADESLIGSIQNRLSWHI